MKRGRYRTIWVSDTHLGTPGCQARALLEFLDRHECDFLYLVGDIIDFWRLKRAPHWAQLHSDVIRTVLAHYLDMTFNDYRRINVDLGALSVVELYDDWVRVKTVNFVPQPGKLWLESFYPTWKKLQHAPGENGTPGADTIPQ